MVSTASVNAKYLGVYIVFSNIISFNATLAAQRKHVSHHWWLLMSLAAIFLLPTCVARKFETPGGESGAQGGGDDHDLRARLLHLSHRRQALAIHGPAGSFVPLSTRGTFLLPAGSAA